MCAACICARWPSCAPAPTVLVGALLGCACCCWGALGAATPGLLLHCSPLGHAAFCGQSECNAGHSVAWPFAFGAVPILVIHSLIAGCSWCSVILLEDCQVKKALINITCISLCSGAMFGSGLTAKNSTRR